MPGLYYLLFHEALTPLTPSTPSSGGQTFTQAVAALSPTAHWTLGESSGTDAADETGNHDGTYVNTPTLGVSAWASDGTGITLDRSQAEGVQVPDHADFDIGTGDVSFLFAIKPPATWYTSDYQEIIGKDNGGGYAVFLTPTEDRIAVWLDGSGFDMNLTSEIDDGNWHLLLVTLDRDANAAVYVDGNSTAEATVNISSKSAYNNATATDLYIGKDPSAYPLSGSLQHVAMWKGTLITGSQFNTLYQARNGTGSTSSQADTYANAVLTRNPVAYYKMDEPSGSTMLDSSSTAQAGSYQGSPTLGVAGPFTGATGVTFDGSTQWAQAPYNAALDFTASEDFSIVLWAKSSVDNIYRNLIGRTGGGDWDDYDLQMAYDQLRSHFANAAETASIAAASSATYALDTGAWRMIAMTADRDGNCTFYVDNVADGTTSISSYAHELTGNKTLYIARASGGNYWAGTLCQVAIFDSLLSASDISALWTAAGN